MLCASCNDDYSVASVHGRPSARPIALLPLLFAVLDLLVLLDQAKSTEEKMHDRRNRFLLREASRTSDWAFPARSGFTTFCHRKVAPKVSAGRKSRGTADGLRLKRYADELAPAFSTAQPRPFFFPIFRKAERLYALAVSPTLRG